jgi:ABC-2 type transport system ATP-binding protein
MPRPVAAVELRADDVCVAFPRRGGATPVASLNGVSVTVRRGDRVALLGPNGSGKSTLLRTLAGIYVPQSGQVKARGKVVGLFEYWQGLHREATGWENAVTLGILQGRSRGEIEASRAAILAMAGLDGTIDRPVRGWSPGMMLRLAFAVATAWPPDILLVDEVLSVADDAFAALAQRRLMDLAKTTAAMVLASHDLTLLRAIANRALVLEHGRIAFDGDVEAAIAYHCRAGREAAWNG